MRPRLLLAFLLLLPLAGCYSDQAEQLTSCQADATHTFPKPTPGQPMKAIQACMDKAGYRFIGWNDGVTCGMTDLVRGQASSGAVICFEPKAWLALKLYRLEMPSENQTAAPS